jgi:BolA protein
MSEDRLVRIREALAPLAPLHLELVDDSARHRGHAGARGGAGHYVLTVVSARFSGLGRVARHRLVYDLLAELFEREIHALSLTLLAPAEQAGAVP